MPFKPPLRPDTFIDDFNEVAGAADRAERFGAALGAGGSNLLDVLATLVEVTPHVAAYLTAHPQWDADVLAVFAKVAHSGYLLHLLVVDGESGHPAPEIRVLDDGRLTAVIVVYADPTV